jgi:hypothetical protein
MSTNDFDQLMSTLLASSGGNAAGFVPKEASAPTAPAPTAPVVDPNASGTVPTDLEGLIKYASSVLSPEEQQLADQLGYLEAANTAKQANYLKNSVGGNQMNFNNPYFQLAQAQKTAGLSAVDLAKLEHNISKAPAASADVHAAAVNMLNDLAKPSPMQQIKQMLNPPANPNPLAELEHAGKSRLQRIMASPTAQKGKAMAANAYGAMKANPGRTAAGLAAVGAAGYGASRLMRPAAKVEQALGRKILNHVSKHGLAYGLGAGALGAAALYGNKSASVEDQLMSKAASDAYDFLGNLGASCYNNAIENEIAAYLTAVGQVNQGQ